ncbi:MAG: hypothetical protein E6H04_15030 [Bacillati bacterium ANGP1]|uniref:GNAT family N-acetyltransferase n=1 Tax=Candidatus Segetimicrobium genomatis TaxID=2569760 RepID=A0A537IYN5_9BACT|nr:MAG: hypothetical protein E6H04_15030 [Terrabacteria group bacterium ANGP1]
MNVVRCATLHAFLERAGAFLLGDEACHNLLLGAPSAPGSTPAPPPYLAVALDAGLVVAAALMTPPSRLVLSRTDRPQVPAAIARSLLAIGMRPPGVHGPVPVGEQFARAWRELTGQGYEQGLTQRIYRLGRVRPVDGVPGRLRQAQEADRPMLVRWVRAFLGEAFGEDRPPTDAEQMVGRRLEGPAEGLCLWDDGGPRALAGFAGPTANGIRVGPVYTRPRPPVLRPLRGHRQPDVQPDLRARRLRTGVRRGRLSVPADVRLRRSWPGAGTRGARSGLSSARSSPRIGIPPSSAYWIRSIAPSRDVRA